MSAQTVQVFIRSVEAGATNPIVIASYPASRPVSSDTHGPGMSVYTLPMTAIQQPTPSSGFPNLPTLVDNWQSMASAATMGAMRISEAFTLSEQISSLHHTVECLQKYGPDPSHWPADAQQRQTEINEKWKYVEAVNERIRAYTAARPHDLGSDKAWPTPPK